MIRLTPTMPVMSVPIPRELPDTSEDKIAGEIPRDFISPPVICSYSCGGPNCNNAPRCDSGKLVLLYSTSHVKYINRRKSH